MDPNAGRWAGLGGEETLLVTVERRALRDEPVQISLAGALDLFNARRLTDALTRLVDDGARSVVVDLEGVSVLDSSGLVALVKIHRRLRGGGGQLAVVIGHNADVARKLELTGLDRVFVVMAPSHQG